MKKSTKLTIPLFIASVLLSSQSIAANNDKIARECEHLGMEVMLLAYHHASEKCSHEVNYSGAIIMSATNSVSAGEFKKGLYSLGVAESLLAKVANSPKDCAYFSPLIRRIMPRVSWMHNEIAKEDITSSK